MKTETAVLILGMSGVNISTVKFLATGLGTVFDLVNWVDQVKIPKLKVRCRIQLNLQASKVRTTPMLMKLSLMPTWTCNGSIGCH